MSYAEPESYSREIAWAIPTVGAVYLQLISDLTLCSKCPVCGLSLCYLRPISEGGLGYLGPGARDFTA